MTLAPSLNRIDDLVAATPEHRDRTVDFWRAAAIAVVVLWHWTFSVAQWNHGRLALPNPIDAVPFAWTATWLLQVMPLFFLAGGYANRSSWLAAKRRGEAPRRWVVGRLARLVKPCAVMAAAWLVVGSAASALLGVAPVWVWGRGIFVPLWFLAAFGFLSAITPWLNTLHERAGRWALVGMAAAAAGLDGARFGAGWVGAGGVPNALAVFALVHQAGFHWRDLVRTASGPALRRCGMGLVGAGLVGLVVATRFGPYGASMVATNSSPSNMWPTTVPIAALGALQLGVALWLRAPLSRLLARPQLWRAVIVANGLAMDIFAWHMTAFALVFLGWSAVGLPLPTQVSALWWALRPLWLVLPGVVLAAVVWLVRRLAARSRPAAPDVTELVCGPEREGSGRL